MSYKYFQVPRLCMHTKVLQVVADNDIFLRQDRNSIKIREETTRQQTMKSLSMGQKSIRHNFHKGCRVWSHFSWLNLFLANTLCLTEAWSFTFCQHYHWDQNKLKRNDCKESKSLWSERKDRYQIWGDSPLKFWISFPRKPEL